MRRSTYQLACKLGEQLTASRRRVTSAESCTGGGVASAMTEVAGSSRWFQVGYVTYSNQHKQQVLGVAETVLAEHGAVSESVVRAMVSGAVRASGADYGIAISGIAGPGGGSSDKPVGTVWFAWQGPLVSGAVCRLFDGDRRSVRAQAVEFSLQQLLHLASQ